MADSLQEKDNYTKEDVDLERIHFQRVLNAFLYYKSNAIKRVRRAEKYVKALPQHHQDMIIGMNKRLEYVEQYIEINYKVIHLIINNTYNMFENKDSDPINKAVLPATDFDMDKVKTTLKQIVRDWSEEGQSERQACYEPIIQELLHLYNVQQMSDAAGIKILVPGAGLGRLAFDIANKGFDCQGNEFSFYMLFTAHFILNRCNAANSYTIYPWIHQYCNHKSAHDQLRAVHFPDVNPTGLSKDVMFSMVAGDFLEIYTDLNYWDSICTVFFIDTANNILSYVEVIYKILKPGGYWINMGPLLYHFADMANESSIELTYEELREVILKFNFEVVKEKLDVPSNYTTNRQSMMQYIYNCVYFVARKPLTEPDNKHNSDVCR